MINWRLFPFVRIALSFIAGICIGDKFDFIESFGSLSILMLLFIAYLLLNAFYTDKETKGKLLSILLLFLFFFLGHTRYQFNQPDSNPDLFEKHLNQGAWLVGIVLEKPKVRSSAKTEIKIVQVCQDTERCINVSGKLLAYFSKEDTVAANYRAGDKIRFPARIDEIKGSGNPKSFDYKSYLRYRHVFSQTYINPGNHVLLGRDQFNRVYTFASRLREAMFCIYRKYLGEGEQLSIVSAMILGYRNAISDDLYQAFSDAGAVHVLAVSGLHVGIVASAVLFFLDRIKSRNNWAKSLKIVVLLLVIWIFSIMTGAAPAVLRAALMFSMLWVGKYWFDYQNMFNILAFSALVMLFFDPYLLFQASFQFSYTAMVSLMYFQPIIYKKIALKNKTLRLVWSMTSAAIAAQVLVFPITVYFFHKFPLYFILSGVISVFLGVLTLYLGLILVGLEVVFPAFNVIFGKLFFGSSLIFIHSVKCIKAIPLSSIDGLWISDEELFFIYISLFAIMYFLKFRTKAAIYIFAISLNLALLFYGYRNLENNNHLGLTVYDNHKSTVIDIFDSRTLYTFETDTISAQELKFVCENNRSFFGVEDQRMIDLDQKTEGLRVRIDEELVHLKDKLIYIPEGLPEAEKIKSADYVVVTSLCKWELPEDTFLSNKTIVIDKTVKRYLVKEIVQSCPESRNCVVHNIADKGAFELELK